MTVFANTLKIHTEQFLRAEKRLLYEIAGQYDGTPIDDPDLEKPIQERIEEIKTDPHALQEFLRKNKDGYDKSANPKDGKDACYLARYTYAVRAAQRVLGELLLPWPPLMQQLLAQVTHPDLQRLMKEERILDVPQKQETPAAPAPELAEPTPTNDFHRLILDLVRRSIQEVEQAIKQIESLKQQTADPRQTALTVLQRILEEGKVKLPPLLFNRWADRLTSFGSEKQARMINQIPSGSYLILGRNSETGEDVFLAESDQIQPDRLKIQFSQSETLEVTSQMFDYLLRQTVHEFEQKVNTEETQ